MHKILIAMFVSLLSFGALACDGDKGKDKQEDKKFQASTFEFTNFDRR